MQNNSMTECRNGTRRAPDDRSHRVGPAELRADQQRAEPVPGRRQLRPAARRPQVGLDRRRGYRPGRHHLGLRPLWRQHLRRRDRQPRSFISTPPASCSAASAPACSTSRTACRVDKDGNVWVTDHGANPPNDKGQVVYKFSPDGKVLLTLGKTGVAGNGPDTFNQPSDVDRRAERRHLRRRRPRPADQRPHREVLEGRQVHQDVGQPRRGRSRSRGAACAGVRFARPAVRRRPHQQPRPGVRPGRQAARVVEAVRPAERDLTSIATT